MKIFYYLQLILCLCESVFVHSNYIQTTEIAFTKRPEKNHPLHYQLALQGNNQDVTQGPTWKQTRQGIYLEEPRFYEVPVKASILVAPLHYVPTQHVKQFNQDVITSTESNPVKLKYSKDDTKTQENTQEHKKPSEVNYEESKNIKQYINPKDPKLRKVKHGSDEKPLIDYTKPIEIPLLKTESTKYLKDDKIRDKKKSKKIKSTTLKAEGSKNIEKVQDPEERITEEFYKINQHSDLPREHKKEQQYLAETSETEPTTFKTPIDDEFEKLSQENLHFVQENLFGTNPNFPPAKPAEINDLTTKEASVTEDSNKKEVKTHGRGTKKQKYNKKYFNKNKDNKSDNTGNIEYHSKHEEKGHKTYDDKHNLESKELKDRSKEIYKGNNKDEGNNKKKFDHEEGHIKKSEESDKAHKHDIFEEKEGHKKGHKTKGYHNKFHKDEVHREHKFYDDDKDATKYHTKKEDTIVNKVVGNDARILQGINNRRQFIPVYENVGHVHKNRANIRNNIRHNINNKNNLIKINHNNQKKYIAPLRNPPTRPGVRYYSIYNKNQR